MLKDFNTDLRSKGETRPLGIVKLKKIIMKKNDNTCATQVADFSSIDRKGLDSLGNYHKNGGEITEGMEVLLERNYRTPLQAAKIVSFHIEPVKMDITGIGKYMNALTYAIVIPEGKTEAIRFPFTMILVKKA